MRRCSFGGTVSIGTFGVVQIGNSWALDLTLAGNIALAGFVTGCSGPSKSGR